MILMMCCTHVVCTHVLQLLLPSFLFFLFSCYLPVQQLIIEEPRGSNSQKKKPSSYSVFWRYFGEVFRRLPIRANLRKPHDSDLLVDPMQIHTQKSNWTEELLRFQNLLRTLRTMTELFCRMFKRLASEKEKNHNIQVFSGLTSLPFHSC